jgi:hypothetical protein
MNIRTLTIQTLAICLVFLAGYFAGLGNNKEESSLLSNNDQVEKLETQKFERPSQNGHLSKTQNIQEAGISAKSLINDTQEPKLQTPDPGTITNSIAINGFPKSQDIQVKGDIQYDWSDIGQWEENLEQVIFNDIDNGDLAGVADIENLYCDKGTCQVEYLFYEKENSTKKVSELIKNYKARADIMGYEKTTSILLSSIKTTETGMPSVNLIFKRNENE